MKEIRARLAAILASLLITYLAKHIQVSEDLAQQINTLTGVGIEVVFVTLYAVLHPIFKRYMLGRSLITAEPKGGV